jgi:hypothetical protein
VGSVEIEVSRMDGNAAEGAELFLEPPRHREHRQFVGAIGA